MFTISDHFRVVFEYWNLYPHHLSSKNITARQEILFNGFRNIQKDSDRLMLNPSQFYLLRGVYFCEIFPGWKADVGVRDSLR